MTDENRTLRRVGKHGTIADYARIGAMAQTMVDQPENSQTTRWPAWQLIETAPRDGTTIFGQSYKMGQRGMVHWNGTGWEMVNGLTNLPQGIGFSPTHWTPLPPAPEPT